MVQVEVFILKGKANCLCFKGKEERECKYILPDEVETKEFMANNLGLLRKQKASSSA